LTQNLAEYMGELTMNERQEVSGGPRWVPVIAAAVGYENNKT